MGGKKKNVSKTGSRKLNEVEGKMDILIGDPDLIASKSSDIGKSLREVAGVLYDIAKTGSKSNGLPLLHTGTGFDVEQIYPQMEPLSADICRIVDSKLAAYGGMDVSNSDVEMSEEESAEDEEPNHESEYDADEETEESDGSETAAKKKKMRLSDARKILAAREEDELLKDIEAEHSRIKGKRKKGEDEEELLLDKLEADIGESGTDDSFEGNLIQKVKKPKKENQKDKKSKPSKLETGYDLDDGLLGEGEGEEDEEDEEFDEEMMAEMRADTETMQQMYGVGNYDKDDGFGEQDEDERKHIENEDFLDDEEEVEIDSLDGDDDMAPKDGLTPFQQRQNKLTKKIKNIEDERLKPTHWSLAGETMQSARPENALLEEFLEFDHTQNARPLVTEEVTKSLEERLKRRILDDVFDDVVRKQARSTAMDLKIEHRNEIDMHTKSKVGLADLYEKEWLDSHRKQLESAGETTHELTEEEKEELKVIQMWRALASNLDLLSNFYYTPRPQPVDELKIRSSTNSAIAMEEAMPSSTTNATLMAPQDTKAPSHKKFANHGEDELTTSEKKARRRLIKINHKAKEQRIEHQKEKSTAIKSRIKKISKAA